MAQIGLLVGNLLGGAVAGLGDGADEVRSPLAHPLLGLLLLVVVVQHGREALIPAQLHRRAVLKHGHKCEVKRLILPHQHCGREPLLLHGLHQPLQSVRQPLPAAGTLEGQLPGDEGGQAAEGVQQPTVLPLPLRGPVQHQRPQGLRLQGGGVQLAGWQGKLVEHPRHEGPLGGQVPLHPAQAVGDPPLLIQHEQVGPPTDALQHQPALHPVTQFAEGLKPELQHPLHGGLGNVQDPSVQEVLAQQHAEHGGRLRVFPGKPGQVSPWMGGIGGQQQPHIPLARPQVEHHLVPGGLVNLVHLTAQDGSPKLCGHGGQADGIQWHSVYSSIIRVNSWLSRSVSPRRYSQPNRASRAVAV